MSVRGRLKHAWNAFLNIDMESQWKSYANGVSYGARPDRTRLSFSSERSIIASILTRVSMDAASIDFKHVRLDEDDRYLETIDSGLNNCLTLEANLDQIARAFFQDAVMTLLDKGCIAIVPVDTTNSPINSNAYDVLTMRVGEVVGWMPEHVRVSLYNEKTGRREEVTLAKKFVAIAENPLFAIMNEPNSTLQRLIRKLNLLDANDEAVSSGKLDLIIQLPYVVKSETRRKQAEQRRKDIEFQLRSGPYGIAYADGTERITQLNRPVENNLLGQVEYLFASLYGQLGLTTSIMDGTADEKTMLNYMNRTIHPIVDAFAKSMKRTFLSKTARSQKQSIEWFADAFKLVPISEIAEIADVFSRNEILTPNELRQIIGFKPSKDKNADKLINSNMPQKPGMPQVGKGRPIQATVGQPLPRAAITAAPEASRER